MLNPVTTLIIVPAFNEELNIVRVLDELLTVPIEADILVVNDGSSDLTEEIASKYPVKVITHPCNLGVGAALQTGYRFASKKGYIYCLQLDSDGQHDPKELPQLIEILQSGEADVVIGSRFMKGSGKFELGWFKKVAITFFRSLIFIFTGVKISDPTSGLRGFSKRVFTHYAMKNQFPSDYPDADILIHMILSRFRIKEIPVNMRPRNLGKSMHSGLKPIMYMMKILLSILLVVLRHRMEKIGVSK